MPAFRAFFLTLIMALLMAGPTSATPIANSVENPKLVGEARLKVMLWNVFDAALHAEDGIYDANKPFALSLTYLRALKSSGIIDKSMEEIERLSSGQLPDETMRQWRQSLSGIFPDVSKGTTITGVRTVEGFSRFYRDGEFLGEIQNPMFSQLFFSIWLGENTRNPTFRSRLLGLNKTS